MKSNNEFDKIGKKTTYQVPDGFFEQVSERTLLKAKKQEENRRKNLIIWRTVALAASLLSFAMLGYYMTNSEKPETTPIAQQLQPTTKQPIDQSKIIPVPSKVTEIKRGVLQTTNPKENYIEELSTVLSDMTDDELLQLAAMYKSDLFIGESPQ